MMQLPEKQKLYVYLTSCKPGACALHTQIKTQYFISDPA
jgi:hypothetical protein